MIQLENFDREFSFEQLVPEAIIKSVIPFLKKMGADGIAIYSPDFSLGFTDNFALPSHIDIIRNTLKTLSNNQAGKIEISVSDILYFPIVHEGEPVAYFVIRLKKNCRDHTDILMNAGFLLMKFFHHFMEMNQKMMMAADLHTIVVEDSFTELKEKNQKLEKSEKKYRDLAKSLEAEVEKKTKEIKYKQAQLLHQDKMASIGQLAAGVAHEINNPIGFINSNLETLKRYHEDLKSLILEYRKLIPFASGDKIPGKSEEIKNLIDNIRQIENMIEIDFISEDIVALLHESQDGIDRIRKIVTTLKDFAHPGKDFPEFADINQNIESTLNILHNEIKHKADVIKDYGKLPDLCCYPRQLNQVFMNILVNAVQAIETHGTISITTRHKDTNILILFSDTGSGIPKKNLRKIFDPFFTTKEVGKGTGLGLNLVYGIIKNHGGRTDVASVAGKGTQFVITLPLNSPLHKKGQNDGDC